MATAVRARWAITGVFGGNGLLIASLAVRTPSLQLDLDLTTGQLGLLSALFGISAVIAVGVAPGFRPLAIAQLLIGALHGTLDVGMNSHAVAVEKALRRPILNGCHAAWSIGAVVGSLLGSLAVQAGLSRAEHYVVLAMLLIPAAWLAGRSLLPIEAHEQVAEQRTQWWRGWSPRVVLFGAMGATVLTAEAAVANWSG